MRIAAANRARLALLPAALLALGMASRPPQTPPADRAKGSSAEAAACARKAVLARDIALKALENAFSAQSDAQRKFAEAVRGGLHSQMLSARTELARARGAANEAAGLAEEISRLASEATSSANAAAGEALRAANATNGRESEQSAGKAADLAAAARKAADKAQSLCDTLKTKWLLPFPAEQPAGPGEKPPAGTEHAP